MKKVAILVITLALIISGCGKKQTNDFNINIDSNENSKSHTENHNNMDELEDAPKEKLGKILKGSNGQKYQEHIYYIDDEHDISKIDEETFVDEKVLDISEKVEGFIINEDRIFYYVNEMDENILYVTDIKGNGERRAIHNMNLENVNGGSLLDKVIIDDDSIYSISGNEINITSIAGNTTKSFFQHDDFIIKTLEGLENNRLYFTVVSNERMQLYMIDTNAENLQIITDLTDNNKVSQTFKNYGDWTYYINTGTVSRLIKFQGSGFKETIFTGFDIKTFTVTEECLYVLDGLEGNSNSLYVTYANGKTKLLDDSVFSFDLLEDQIFYVKVNEDGNFTINRRIINTDSNTDLIGKSDQILLFKDSEIVTDIIPTVGYIYYVLGNGNLYRYNISTAIVTEVGRNVSKLKKLGKSIYFGDEEFNTLYFNNISEENIEISGDKPSDINKEENVLDKIDSEIIDSEETSPKTDRELLEELITNFDNAWADYVNEEHDNVANYIVPDSPVKQHIANFDRESVTEDFLSITVLDVKINGDEAEVDVDEKISKITHGNSEIKDYKWTYIVKKIDEEWKIYNYRVR